MTHRMQLQDEPFEQIRRGDKTIELRLYDEKRQAIRVGDTILFTRAGAPGETLACRVVCLHRFDSFAALYRALPLLRCGYTPENVDRASPSDMDRYYSPARQRQYGVLGIELKLL